MKRFLDDYIILRNEIFAKLEVLHKLWDEMNPIIKITKDTSEKE